MSKKIVVELNQKSIKDAIKQLKNTQKVIQDQLMPEYMQRSADWIINRANEILEQSDIGEDVISVIEQFWFTEWVGKNHLLIKNAHSKAVYVEFGVGIIGQGDKHPTADKTGYEYNVESDSKFGQGFWKFRVTDETELDIPQEAIIYQKENKNSLSIITQGTKGVWFLYNAVEDFKLREKERLWKELSKKYLG